MRSVLPCRSAATRPSRPAILAALLGVLALLAQPAAGQTRVEIELADDDITSGPASFGVGGIHRPGEDVGIRVTVRAGEGDFGAATNVLLQWEMPNADGDIAEVRRVVALTAGGSATTWLYGTLPPDLSPDQTWTIRAFLYDEDAGGARGAEIGTTIIQAPPAGRLPIETSVIGRVGSRDMGLAGYRLPVLTGARSGDIITAHEETIVRPLDVPQLPDAWPGLMPYDVLVWADRDPGRLTARQEAAVRDWLAGGGHLVIVLPFDGNPWRLGDPGAGPLGDLLPPREPTTVVDVPIERLVPTLSKSRRLGAEPVNDGLELKVFDDLLDDQRGLDPGWEPLVVTDAAQVIAIRRSVGHGHLSIVGLPLGTSTQLTSLTLGHGLIQTSSLPQADAFWNRVLGRRSATPTTAELASMPREQVVAGAPERRLIDGSVIADTITMSEEAGAGLLLALVLFIGYWLLAGPIGFAVLKGRGQVRHAWVGFVVAAAIFTGLAWVGVTALRKRDLDVRHFTVLDWVADDGSGLPGPPQMARINSWMSLYLPTYGSAEVALGDTVAAGGRSRLWSWVPSMPSGRSRPQAFPNADRYAVDGSGRTTGPIDLPARATVTQLQADWRGPLDGAWGGVLRSDPDDPVRVIMGADGEPVLAGSLINGLPKALRDVTVIWVKSDRLTRVRYVLDSEGRETPALPLADPDRMVQEVAMWSYTPTFEPDMRIPLQLNGGAGGTGGPSSLGTRFAAAVDEWMDPFESDGSTFGVGRDVLIGRAGPRRLMNMVSVFDQLPAPVWRADVNGRRADTVRLSRLFGRTLDLSPWFVRPCVIVIGYVEDVATPLPLQVEGRPIGGSGTVMMRWILPLDTDVERAFEMELDVARADRAARRADRADAPPADTEAGNPAGES